MANPVLPTGCEMPKAPAEQWITEYRVKSVLGTPWVRSGDHILCDIFSSREDAQAAVDKDAPNCRNIVRRVSRRVSRID
jgi:hypothetical protein